VRGPLPGRESVQVQVTILHEGSRWYIFISKIPHWICFGGPWNGNCWYTYFIAIWNILWPFGMFYGHLECFTAVLYCCGHLAYFSVFWNIVPRKI
jgi:hypothetical protein